MKRVLRHSFWEAAREMEETLRLQCGELAEHKDTDLAVESLGLAKAALSIIWEYRKSLESPRVAGVVRQ